MLRSTYFPFTFLLFLSALRHTLKFRLTYDFFLYLHIVSRQFLWVTFSLFLSLSLLVLKATPVSHTYFYSFFLFLPISSLHITPHLMNHFHMAGYSFILFLFLSFRHSHHSSQHKLSQYCRPFLSLFPPSSSSRYTPPHPTNPPHITGHSSNTPTPSFIPITHRQFPSSFHPSISASPGPITPRGRKADVVTLTYGKPSSDGG